MIDLINFHPICINFSEFRMLFAFLLRQGMGRVAAGVDGFPILSYIRFSGYWTELNDCKGLQ